jgi:hypothetical protein
LLPGPPPPERPAKEEATGPQLRQIVRRSIEFLEKEGAAWMKKQQCASCHHIPVMVWALSDASHRGYRVNEKLLGEVAAWALAAANHAQIFPDLPLDRTRLAIRFGVILRKVWGGSRTWAGARAQSVLMSVWRTCSEQGRSALDFLSQLLRGMPVVLPFPP